MAYQQGWIFIIDILEKIFHKSRKHQETQVIINFFYFKFFIASLLQINGCNELSYNWKRKEYYVCSFFQAHKNKVRSYTLFFPFRQPLGKEIFWVCNLILNGFTDFSYSMVSTCYTKILQNRINPSLLQTLQLLVF